MEIYIDSADLAEIKNAIENFGAAGATTNPTLMHKAAVAAKEKNRKFDLEAHIKAILELAGRGRFVSLEVLGKDLFSMYPQAMKLYEKFNKAYDNVVIKIPVCPAVKSKAVEAMDGIKVIDKLERQGIRVNATLIMVPFQAYAAACAGASFASPFIGRMHSYLNGEIADVPVDKRGLESGDDLIVGAVQSVRGTKTKIIAASIRTAEQFYWALEAGVHIVTVPYPVMVQLGKEALESARSHPLYSGKPDKKPDSIARLLDDRALPEQIFHLMTAAGMKAFMKDAADVPEYAALFRNRR